MRTSCRTVSVYWPGLEDISIQDESLKYLLLIYTVDIYIRSVSICLSIFLYLYLSIYPFIYLCIYLSIIIYIYLSIYFYLYLSIHLTIYLTIHLSIYLGILVDRERGNKPHIYSREEALSQAVSFFNNKNQNFKI